MVFIIMSNSKDKNEDLTHSFVATDDYEQLFCTKCNLHIDSIYVEGEVDYDEQLCPELVNNMLKNMNNSYAVFLDRIIREGGLKDPMVCSVLNNQEYDISKLAKAMCAVIDNEILKIKKIIHGYVVDCSKNKI